MKELGILFENNRKWADSKRARDPTYFERLASSHKPRYMWIGCADSRVPANEIVGLDPGELFVHRNVANLIPNSDVNCLSVLEFGIDILKIEHVIICGHYGCNGVKAAMEHRSLGLIDNWLRDIRDVYATHSKELNALQDEDKRFKRLVELNVIEQVRHVCHTTIVQNAWQNSQPLWIHGWVYDMTTGLLKDLNCCISSVAQIEDVYRASS